MHKYRWMIATALLMLCAAPAFADGLQAKLDALAQRARPAHLGITVIDLRSGQAWRVGAGRAYPMMSVFKAPLGAALLDRVDRGELSLDRNVTITRADLRHGLSAITKHFHGQAMHFTVRQLLTAAVGDSDNTAADALLPLVGGPTGLTAWLRANGIDGMRVDRGEGGIYHDVMGLDAHDQPSLGETDAEADARIRRGFFAYMHGPRDTSTPDAAAAFLRKLWRGELLSAASTRWLLDTMTHTQPFRIEPGLPKEVRFAHKGGTSGTFDDVTAAFNDIGVIRWPDGRAVVVAAFLTGSTRSVKEREGLFAELGRVVAGDVGKE
jgi:beta-lactamase class A